MEEAFESSYHRHVVKIHTISIYKQKRPSDVINALMQRWVVVLSVMGAIMTDNGEVFSSDEMRS